VSVLSDDRLLWFVNRGSGVVVLVLLTASTALGVLATVRTTSSRWPRFVTQALHRNIALLSLVLLAVHAGTAIADSYVDLTVADAFVPFAAAYRPFWTALGTVALDLVLLAVVTSLARHRFGLRRWRAVHLTTYLAWPAGLAHGLGIGTDQRATWSVVLTAICVGVVAGALSLRLTGRGDGRPGEGRPVGPSSSGRRSARAAAR
jgi:methionine sulfoxide reductase heme-binding subunit